MPASDNQQLTLTQPDQPSEMQRFMPVMPITMAVSRHEQIVEAVQKLMVEATEANGFTGDYGIIPGTKQRTLLNPGADKLNNLFGLVPGSARPRQLKTGRARTTEASPLPLRGDVQFVSRRLPYGGGGRIGQ